jgi:hypothetical protein
VSVVRRRAAVREISGWKLAMWRVLLSRWPTLIALALLATLSVFPLGLVEHGPVLCTFRNLFGVRCPGCGLTRAFACLMHGRLSDAWAYNPLAFVLLPAFSICSIRDLAGAVIKIRTQAHDVAQQATEAL